MLLALGYGIIGLLTLFISVAVHDRYWDSQLLQGLVRPREPLIYEGRSWRMEDPQKLEVVGLPVTCRTLLYHVLFSPEGLVSGIPLIISIWTPLGLMSLFAVINHAMGPEEPLRHPDGNGPLQARPQ
ncbi:MAG: hypothetical protein EAX95_10105 [Candidatus Thorarchaeota archaeon]|nr:hypothetical protein [Candidatus Thorarchaeota archaeon]